MTDCQITNTSAILLLCLIAYALKDGVVHNKYSTPYNTEQWDAGDLPHGWRME